MVESKVKNGKRYIKIGTYTPGMQVTREYKDKESITRMKMKLEPYTPPAKQHVSPFNNK